jgi:hypothetical protein
MTANEVTEEAEASEGADGHPHIQRFMRTA